MLTGVVPVENFDGSIKDMQMRQLAKVLFYTRFTISPNDRLSATTVPSSVWTYPHPPQLLRLQNFTKAETEMQRYVYLCNIGMTCIGTGYGQDTSQAVRARRRLHQRQLHRVPRKLVSSYVHCNPGTLARYYFPLLVRLVLKLNANVVTGTCYGTNVQSLSFKWDPWSTWARSVASSTGQMSTSTHSMVMSK